MQNPKLMCNKNQITNFIAFPINRSVLKCIELCGNKTDNSSDKCSAKKFIEIWDLDNWGNCGAINNFKVNLT